MLHDGYCVKEVNQLMPDWKNIDGAAGITYMTLSHRSRRTGKTLQGFQTPLNSLEYGVWSEEKSGDNTQESEGRDGNSEFCLLTPEIYLLHLGGWLSRRLSRWRSYCFV